MTPVVKNVVPSQVKFASPSRLVEVVQTAIWLSRGVPLAVNAADVHASTADPFVWRTWFADPSAVGKVYTTFPARAGAMNPV